MTATALKPGQNVKVATRISGIVPGKFVAEHPGTKGAYLEVDHENGKANKRYRPVKVVAA